MKSIYATWSKYHVHTLIKLKNIIHNVSIDIHYAIGVQHTCRYFYLKEKKDYLIVIRARLLKIDLLHIQMIISRYTSSNKIF